LEGFFRRHSVVYFWTFSEPGRHEGQAHWTKDEAEAHFKPFRDLCARRHYSVLWVWELQKRGSWHPHCLVSGFFDVNWLRPWMMARGWGQQMRAERAERQQIQVSGRDGRGQWRETLKGGGAIISYLVKYLGKGFGHVMSEGSKKKKLWGGTKTSKAGTTAFSWTPDSGRPGRFLFQAGRELFSQLIGRPPTFRDVAFVIRLGVEDTGWASFDPWWEFGFPDVRCPANRFDTS